MEYTSKYDNDWDAQRSGAMRVVGDQSSMNDRAFDKNRNTTVGAWIQRWRPHGGRGARVSRRTHKWTESLFVWYYKELNYDLQLGLIKAVHHAFGDIPFETSLSEAFRLSHAYDQLYFIVNCAYWAKEADPEYRNLLVECYQYLSGWHNVELLALSRTASFEYFVGILANSMEGLECCRVLTIGTPPASSYYSYIVLRDDGGTPAPRHISIIEYAVVELLRFPAAVCDGTIGDTCIGSRLGSNGQSVLVRFPSGFRCDVDDISLLALIHGSSSDPVALLIA